MGVFRYLAEQDDGVMPNTIDAGLRAIYAKSQYATSVEYVFRRFMGDNAPDDKQTHKVMGVVEYRVMKDRWLQISFGKDHKDPQAPDAKPDLVAQLGLTFNFNGDRFKFE